MRYIVNAKNYVTAVSFGALLNYADCDCTEYTGKIPSGWNSLEEWFEDEGGKLWRWKIKSGNLTLDSTAVAPEEGRWGVPKLQNKVVSETITKNTTVSADDGYDGLGNVIILEQPVWNHVAARTEQTFVFNNGGEIWINTKSERMPRMILLECSVDTSSMLQTNSMLLSLTNGVITDMTAYVRISGNIARCTGVSGMSVTNSSGILKIYCNPDICTFYYNQYSQIYDYYNCYLMY